MHSNQAVGFAMRLVHTDMLRIRTPCNRRPLSCRLFSGKTSISWIIIFCELLEKLLKCSYWTEKKASGIYNDFNRGVQNAMKDK